MSLTENDQHLIKKLKNYERRWTYFRWVYIAIGIMIFISGFSAYSFHSEYAMALIAISISHAVINWRGNPYHLLLLKVLNQGDSEQKVVGID
jgi:hypothetical protein